MARYAGQSTTFVVAGNTYTFPPRSLDGFPEAPAFLEYLLTVRVVSPTMAVYYVKIAARLRRKGVLNTPQVLQHRVERTAANGFWRWASDTYDERVRPILRAVNDPGLTQGVRWLRRSSLVPPSPGKVLRRRLLPVPSRPGEAAQPPRTIAEEPYDGWTLHVPRSERTPVHEDPCPDCLVVKLTPEQLEACAVAFERAWGHRNLAAIPADMFLFGTPPASAAVDARLRPTRGIVAVLPEGATATALDQLGGSVSREILAFAERLRANPEASTVALDFECLRDGHLDLALAAVREAGVRWLEAHPAAPARPPAEPLPTNLGPLPGVPEALPVELTDEFAGEPPPPPVLVSVPPEPERGREAPAIDAFAASVLGPVDADAAEGAPKFTDWAAISETARPRLVHCTFHKEAHTVLREDPECRPGAWHDIPQ
jgi:hypothetical protein